MARSDNGMLIDRKLKNIDLKVTEFNALVDVLFCEAGLKNENIYDLALEIKDDIKLVRLCLACNCGRRCFDD